MCTDLHVDMIWIKSPNFQILCVISYCSEIYMYLLCWTCSRWDVWDPYTCDSAASACTCICTSPSAVPHGQRCTAVCLPTVKDIDKYVLLTSVLSYVYCIQLWIRPVLFCLKVIWDWFVKSWICPLSNFITQSVTWVDQKVLTLVAYLHKYKSELHQTYTKYVTTISWFVNVVRMTHYARGNMTSSFDDIMQQWPGVKNVRNCLFQAKCNHQHSCLMWPLFFSRSLWTLRIIIGTNYSLNMQFQFIYLHLQLKDNIPLRIWEK